MHKNIFSPIGTVRTESAVIPRHWTVSNVEGELVINPEYRQGIQDIRSGDRLAVLFLFHESPPFTMDRLVQVPPHRNRKFGVFSICSPVRPNPVGMSVLEVTGIHDNIINVKGIDMLDGTPVIDIKPHIECREQCPGNNSQEPDMLR